MTSANVIEYTISKDGEQVGHYRQNLMCKSNYEELLRFQPLSECTIQPYGYDEEDDFWEDDEENLENYLRKMIPMNKAIKEYFSK